ncbi:MAG: DegT/DnrJ/EryC1/StrS family aminotransferase [Cyanobacteria bacterium J06626_6]
MVYTSKIASEPSLAPNDELPKTVLATLIAQLPQNDLAVFGNRPERSHPYPQWPIADGRDLAAVANVVRSGRWGGAPFPGPQSAQFAHRFAAMQKGQTTKTFAVPMVNGTVTLEVALRAAHIGWGDEVIIPAYTFQATGTAPIMAGAVPILVDVDPQTYCISPAAIEAALTEKTKAIIPVHLGAQVADMDAIMAIGDRHGLIVIEDCAHAHGAQWRGRGVGAFGHFGSFSLQSNKILTAGEGGILLCRTQALADRATSIIDCGRFPGARANIASPTSESPESDLSGIEQLLQHFLQCGGQKPGFSLGSNYRMSEFQAAMGNVALSRFDRQRQEREAMLAYFEKRLASVPGVRLLKRDRRHTQRSFSFYRYIFALVPERFGAAHEEVCLALHAEGIPCTTGYAALHRHSLFQPMRSHLPVPSLHPEKFDYSHLSLPVAEQACSRDAIWIGESVFRAGKQGVEDAIAAIQKVQRNAPILSAAKTAFLRMADQ